MNSTAEVSTGVICICLPPLSVCFSRSKLQKGPTQSILNGAIHKSPSNSYRSKGKVGLDSALALNDEAILNADYLELKNTSSYKLRVERSQRSQVARIIGGTQCSGSEFGGQLPEPCPDLGIREEQGMTHHIVRTVEIEQSYN